jgi:hypothetical protein
VLALCSLASCAEPTDLSYDELVEEFRDDNGPFADCGYSDSTCPATDVDQCLADNVVSCIPVEHRYEDLQNGDFATTFVVPTDGSCEIVVLWDLPRNYGLEFADYRQENCSFIELSDTPPCFAHRSCRIVERWNRR